MSDPTQANSTASSPALTCAEDMPCSFSQFLVSLGSSALVHLGEMVDPALGREQVDLKLARHSINLLAMLQEKTSGNLDVEERELLDVLLKDLGAKYEARRTA